MKRIICLVLTIAFSFSLLSCHEDNDRDERNRPCSEGHSFTTTYTNTCDEDGYKISICSVCDKEKKEEAKATGHNFEKNDCKNCNYRATEISQLPLEHRKELAKEIKSIAPVSSDLETLCAVGDAYLLTIRDLENFEKALQTAINKYNSVPLVRVLDENGKWTWVQHEPSLIEAKNEMEQAKQGKAYSEELLETLEISLELNAQGAAWEVLIEELESETTSSKKVASRLTAIFIAYAYPTGITNPSWKQDIFDIFKEITGLEIDMSQALS